MSENFKLGLVIGGAVSATVGKAFKEVQSKIKDLDDKGAKARILQSTIGETIKLRNEWKRAHETGAAGASTLLSRLNANLEALKAQGVQVGRLSKEYQALGRVARAAELKSKGRQQIDQGRAGLKSTAGQAVAATAAVAVPTKVSAEYGAIIRDIAIKAGVANTPQEAQMSQTIVQTSRDTGMARNDVAEVVNALVGAGMDLKQAISYAPTAAKFVVGQGADGADTAKMINALGQNAKISDPKVMQQALEAIAYQGQAGSFEASDMARWFPEMLASMGKLGITGMDSVTQLGALLQVQMKTAGGADEAANNLKNWMEKIGSSDTVTAYKKAGIDYEGSMRTGLQKGMSTLESSFELAQRYIEKIDPKKAKEMAEATAKISKEADPVKAKAMMNSLEQALRTGDLFADMQVKAALTAFMQNKKLYETLKKDSREASGILDKNLAERRDASAQKWKEVGQSIDDVMRSVGDAIAPATDAVAGGITNVSRAVAEMSDGSRQVVAGVGAAVAGFIALRGVMNTVKIGRGLLNLGRGTLMGNPNIPQKVIVMNPSGGGGGGPDLGGADADGKKKPRKRWGRRGSVSVPPVATTAPVVKPRMRVYSNGEVAKPVTPLSSWKPPTSVPSPATVQAVPKPSGLGAGAKAVGGTSVVFAVLDAGIKAKDTYDNAETRDEKAEGYGEAAGSLAGTLAGTAAGAAVGSIVPIIGTAIGALVGGILGSMGGGAAGGYVGKKAFGADESLKQMPTAGPLMMRDAGKSVPPVLGDIAQSFKTPPAPMVLVRPPVVPAARQPVAAAPVKAPGVSVEVKPQAQADKPATLPAAPVPLVKAAPALPAPPVLPVKAPAVASQAPAVVAPLRPVAPPLLAPMRVAPAQTLVTRNEVTHKGPALGDVAKALTPSPAQERAAAPVPAAKAEPAPKPAPVKIEQKIEIHAPLTITVNGDAKDPRQLAQELQPYLQQQQRDIGAQLERSKLYDEPHL
jgi:TP901 family phage tail tape measure protein